MSDCPGWMFFSRVRDDLQPATLRVLEAVARDVVPDDGDLSTLHPVVAYYLCDWTRMLAAFPPPHLGPPVRLSGTGTDEHTLTLEFSQHDDEHANGGYVMWLWALQLLDRPTRHERTVGLEWEDRRHQPPHAITATPDEVKLALAEMSWAELDATWQDLVDDAGWEGWTF